MIHFEFFEMDQRVMIHASNVCVHRRINSEGSAKQARTVRHRLLDCGRSAMASFKPHHFNTAAYVAHQKDLLSLEREEEIAQVSLATSSTESLSATESAGLAVTRLSLHAETSVLGDRSCATFATRGGRELKPGGLKTGDIVAVRLPASAAGGPTELVPGVLTGLDGTRVTVVLDDPLPPPAGDGPALYAVIRATSDVTNSRYRAALDGLARAADDPNHVAHALVGVVFGTRPAGFRTELSLSDAQKNALAGLNDAQRAAAELALRAEHVAVLHGPPGTGKTTAVAALVAALAARGERVLLTAPSNVAADNLAERLASLTPRPRFVRAGHPARVVPSVVPFLLESLVAKSDEAGLVLDIRRELDAALSSARGSKKFAERRKLRDEARLLRKELRKREGDALKRVLASTEVVVCTLAGAGARSLRDAGEFDVVVVDEAGQATEAATWVALLRGKRAVLTGDHLQLPPTVLSERAASGGLGGTLMERVCAREGMREAVCMLTTQYRMNKTISEWASDALYDGKLVPAEGVEDRLLSDIVAGGGEGDEEIDCPFVVIDTADGDCDEEGEDDDTVSSKRGATRTSRRNQAEASIVTEYVETLVSKGVAPFLIGVISPYAGQVELLRDKLRPTYGRALEIATVDSFQGREKDAIVISLVRANDAGEVGFLKEDRRLNVAITRARRSVTVVCDSVTVGNHPFIKRVLEYAERCGEVRAAVAEYSLIVGEGGNQRRPMEAVRAAGKSKTPGEKGEVEKTGKKKKKGGKKKKGAHDEKEDAGASSASATGKPAGERKVHRKKQTGPVEEYTLDDRDNAIYKRMEKLVDMFVNSDLEEHSFPKTINSFERRIIHELAEARKIGHETTGGIHGRVIRIWKIVDSDAEPEVAVGKKEEATDAGGSSVGSGGVPKRNRAMHEAAMARQARADAAKAAAYSDDDAIERGTASTATEGSTVVEEEQPTEDEGNGNADTEPAASTTVPTSVTKPPKRGKRKKGKKKTQQEEDDEFDAALKEYGAPQPEEVRDPVIRIMNGTLKVNIPGASADKRPSRAQEKLTKKLAEAAKERVKKAKKKK